MPALVSNGSLGSLRIRLQLLISQIFQTNSICTVDIKTQLRVANECTTSWLCYSHSDLALTTSTEERFLFFPNFEGIVLERQRHVPLGSEFGNISDISPLHHFQRKSRHPSPLDSSRVIEEIEFQIFENQRVSPLGTFSGDNLFRYERKVFTDESGAIASPVSPYEDEDILPTGYTWYDDFIHGWTIEICTDSETVLSTDNEGWIYGSNFGDIMKKYRQNQPGNSSLIRATRRRKWKRRCFREIDLNNRITKDNENWRITDEDCSVDEFQEETFEDASLSSDNDTLYDILTIDVYQNQRRVLDWGPSGVPFERKHFSNETGDINYDSKEHVHPPSGYVWFDAVWTLDRNYIDTDEDGWCYGITFGDIMSDLKKGVGNIGAGIPPSVRRRKFFRRCVRTGADISSDFESHRTAVEISGISSDMHLSQSKSEAYHEHKDLILKLCQERECLGGPVIIPWNQVIRVDVVTSTVLALIVQVHRYMEDGNGSVTYRPADVEIFIVDCPAQKLCLLIKTRLHFNDLRVDIRDLLSSGTMTGQQGNFIDYSTAETELHLPELTLGSSTILYLENEIAELRSAIARAHQSQDSLQFASLQLHEARCKLYISTLLGSCLIGPNFNEKEVKQMVDIDIQRAKEFSADSQAPVEKFKEKIIFLFHLAESRIRDFALCGWAYRGDAFESCLRVLINKYYSVIVEEFNNFTKAEFPVYF